MSATLYRCRTPTDWLCPCGRVARALKRHDLPVETVRLTRTDRSAVQELTGQGHIPVLDVDEQAIADSKRIVEHLRWRASC